MLTKLTLRLDDRLINKAKISTKKRNKSVSQMVAEYFAFLESTDFENKMVIPKEAVITKSLKGIIKDVSEEDYKKYLEDKYL